METEPKVEQPSEIEKVKAIIATDESIVEWMKGMWENEQRRKAYNALPSRLRNMIKRGYQVNVQIPVMVPPPAEAITRAREMFQKRLDELEKPPSEHEKDTSQN